MAAGSGASEEILNISANKVMNLSSLLT